MSATVDLQLAISTLLGQRGTTAFGDGALTVLPLTHGLGMQYLPTVRIVETAGGRLLVRGVDYELNPALGDPANALKVTVLGDAPVAPAAGAWTATIGRLSVDVPIVKRLEKELANNIAAAAANHGLCIYVMAALPAKTGTPGKKFIFFEGVDVRVRILEQPAINRFGINAYELAEEVQKGLHWVQPALLTHPLYVAAKPLEEPPGAMELGGKLIRVLDVIFNAAYGFRNPPAI
jgi:hypothetical protein